MTNSYILRRELEMITRDLEDTKTTLVGLNGIVGVLMKDSNRFSLISGVGDACNAMSDSKIY